MQPGLRITHWFKVKSHFWQGNEGLNSQPKELLPALQTGSLAISGLQLSGAKPGTESTGMLRWPTEADDLSSPWTSQGRVGWAMDFGGR